MRARLDGLEDGIPSATAELRRRLKTLVNRFHMCAAYPAAREMMGVGISMTQLLESDKLNL